MPGLLQTEEYARAAIQGGPILVQVALRMERQAILASDEPPLLRVVVDEGAVRRQVGGPAVMRAQIDRLLEESHRGNIQILLLPYSAGVGFDGSFVLLDFPPMPAPYPEAAEDRVVYIDTLTGALYLERPAEVSTYSAAYEQLQALALGPAETRDALSKIGADLAA